MVDILRTLFAWLYWRMVRRYWRSPVRNNCPHAEALHRYIKACGRVNDLEGR